MRKGLQEMQERQSGHTVRSSVLSEARSKLIRTVLYPRLLKRWRPTAYSRLRELRKCEFSSPEQIQTEQLSKLLHAVRHAAQHVPYYRKLFLEQGINADKIESREDVSRIPILSKANLQKNIDELCADDRDKA